MFMGRVAIRDVRMLSGSRSRLGSSYGTRTSLALLTLHPI